MLPENDLKILLELRERAGSVIDNKHYRMHLLRLSVISGNYHILKNAAGDVLGYFSWANVISETVARLYRNGEMPCYPYEWSEGGIMLITDVCFLPEFSFEAKSAFKIFLKNKRVITYRKNDKVNFWLKSFQRHSSYPKHFNC